VTPQTKYSILRSWCMRPLPIALAHRFCTVNFGDPQMDVLKRIYRTLDADDRSRCRAEFARSLNLVTVN
jgi:hypothetical protein